MTKKLPKWWMTVPLGLLLGGCPTAVDTLGGQEGEEFNDTDAQDTDMLSDSGSGGEDADADTDSDVDTDDALDTGGDSDTDDWSDTGDSHEPNDTGDTGDTGEDIIITYRGQHHQTPNRGWRLGPGLINKP